MRVKLRNRYDDKYEIEVKLPAESLELYDILDRLDVKNKFGNVSRKSNFKIIGSKNHIFLTK